MVLSSSLSSASFTLSLSGGFVRDIGVGDLHEASPDLDAYASTATAELGALWTRASCVQPSFCASNFFFPKCVTLARSDAILALVQ